MSEFPSHIVIGDRRIGPGEPCFVIAEAGVSHFGEMQKAYQLIDMAVESSADVFKTQHYYTDLLVGPSSPEWRARLRSKEMPDIAIEQMQQYCNSKGIPFLCTAHDKKALEFLDQVLDVPAFKIGSGEVENWPFLAEIASKQKPIILSTGMYEVEQIRDAIHVLSDNGCTQLAVLHCVTNYPADPSQINLKVMHAIREFFPGPVGYSDHTEGTAVPLAAVGLGADIIEKHITIDRDIPNAQDWKVSCDPTNFKQFVSDIRTIEKAVGNGEKKLTDKERASMLWARKSLTANMDISAGTILTEDLLISQRPGTGVPPSRISEIVGKTISHDVKQGELITADLFK